MPDALGADRERIRATILQLLQRRDPGKTICPSDAARALAGERFRPLMAPVRDVAAELADEGRIEVTQRGQPVDPRGARGPIRLRLRRAELGAGARLGLTGPPIAGDRAQSSERVRCHR